MITTLPQGLCIAASTRYVISAREPFDIRAIRPDGGNAEIVHAKPFMKDGRSVLSFETVADAVLSINGEEVTL